MMKTKLLTGMLFVGTALGFSACGPVVPLNPTWKDDVRPLVVARCVRCHDNPPRLDPALVDNNPATPDTPLTSFNEPPDFVITIPPGGGLLLLWGSGPARLRLSGRTRMPPPPAAALEDWQIEMLEAWAAVPR